MGRPEHHPAAETSLSRAYFGAGRQSLRCPRLARAFQRKNPRPARTVGSLMNAVLSSSVLFAVLCLGILRLAYLAFTAAF